jgi:hypothetical protein
MREEEYREIACGWSNNALVWAGFALTEFVLITTLFTAFKVQTNILLELTIALAIIDAVLLLSVPRFALLLLNLLTH